MVLNQGQFHPFPTPWDHLAMSEDIFHCHNWGLLVGRAQYAAKPLKMHTSTHYNKELSGLNVSGATVENPCSRETTGGRHNLLCLWRSPDKRRKEGLRSFQEGAEHSQPWHSIHKAKCNSTWTQVWHKWRVSSWVLSLASVMMKESVKLLVTGTCSKSIKETRPTRIAKQFFLEGR